MSPNQMFLRSLVIVIVTIAAITAFVMRAFGGGTAEPKTPYVPPPAATSPEKRGARLYETKGCVQCHSIDGSPRVGPTLRGSYGTQVALVDGTVLVDDAYIRESLMTPNAKARPGYQQVMPSFQGLLTDHEVEALIAYVRSLH
jgi:mono/diheme cytochrome c family protein